MASWGAYLLKKNILAMSFAPRDTHISQIQFALERGVPAILGIMATIRLPYPARSFDMAHCSRCLIPWGATGKQLRHLPIAKQSHLVGQHLPVFSDEKYVVLLCSAGSVSYAVIHSMSSSISAVVKVCTVMTSRHRILASYIFGVSILPRCACRQHVPN